MDDMCHYIHGLKNTVDQDIFTGEGKYQIFALWFLTQLTTTGTWPSGQTQTPHLYVLLLTDDIRCVWATSQSNHPYLGCMNNALVWFALGL